MRETVERTLSTVVGVRARTRSRTATGDTAIIFSVLLGRIVFRERFFGQRVVGAAIALAGIIIIIFSP